VLLLLLLLLACPKAVSAAAASIMLLLLLLLQAPALLCVAVFSRIQAFQDRRGQLWCWREVIVAPFPASWLYNLRCLWCACKSVTYANSVCVASCVTCYCTQQEQ
jgi:hypothetical protein